jgi:hypothetical protein
MTMTTSDIDRRQVRDAAARLDDERLKPWFVGNRTPQSKAEGVEQAGSWAYSSRTIIGHLGLLEWMPKDILEKLERLSLGKATDAEVNEA